MLYGVDVSEFRGDINFDVLNPVCHFIMIRSCFGTARQDAKFARNRDEARRVGLVRGYYHYAYPEYDVNTPEAEAAFFVANLGTLQAGEILALDWEESYSGDHVDWCLRFLKAVEKATGVKPLLYLNQSLVKSHNWQPVIDNGNGLWLAQYDYQQQAGTVDTPWPVVAMKQWTDRGSVAGIPGSVDGDTFYGDFASFAKYGAKVQKPLTVVSPTQQDTYTTQVGAANAAKNDPEATVTDANGNDVTTHVTKNYPDPTDQITQISHRVGVLEGLVQKIWDFLSKWKRFRQFTNQDK